MVGQAPRRLSKLRLSPLLIPAWRTRASTSSTFTWAPASEGCSSSLRWWLKAAQATVWRVSATGGRTWPGGLWQRWRSSNRPCEGDPESKLLRTKIQKYRYKSFVTTVWHSDYVYEWNTHNKLHGQWVKFWFSAHNIDNTLCDGQSNLTAKKFFSLQLELLKGNFK